MTDINKQIEEGKILTILGEPFKKKRNGYSEVVNGRPKSSKTTHNMSGTRINRIWKNMKTRCNNPNADNYRFYGGRGIAVCERWNSFDNFFADMGQPPTDNHTLDRIDPNGNYEPSNCRWLTIEKQQRNKRSNVFLTFKGKTMCVSEWADELGLKSATIYQRIRRGLPIEKILKPID